MKIVVGSVENDIPDELRTDAAMVLIVESGPPCGLRIIEIPDGIDWYVETDPLTGEENIVEESSTCECCDRHRRWF